MRITHLVFVGIVAAASTAAAQIAGVNSGHVPVHGITGTIALPGNVDKIYDGLNTLIVTTTDGARHVIHVTDDTKVHGADTLASLQRGTPVVVHYTSNGGEILSDEIDSLGPGGLKSTEGTVTAVDRVRKTITVKYTTGWSQTLKLSHHAAVEGEATKGNRVIVYYTNESGQKVAHYFKRKS